MKISNPPALVVMRRRTLAGIIVGMGALTCVTAGLVYWYSTGTAPPPRRSPTAALLAASQPSRTSVAAQAAEDYAAAAKAAYDTTLALLDEVDDPPNRERIVRGYHARLAQLAKGGLVIAGGTYVSRKMVLAWSEYLPAALREDYMRRALAMADGLRTRTVSIVDFRVAINARKGRLGEDVAARLLYEFVFNTAKSAELRSRAVVGHEAASRAGEAREQAWAGKSHYIPSLHRGHKPTDWRHDIQRIEKERQVAGIEGGGT